MKSARVAVFVEDVLRDLLRFVGRVTVRGLFIDSAGHGDRRLVWIVGLVGVIVVVRSVLATVGIPERFGLDLLLLPHFTYLR